MADSYSVQAVLSVKDKNFTSTMKSAQSTLSGLDSSSKKSSSSVGALGTAFAVAEKVVSAACNVIKNSVSEAVARVDTLNQYPQIMEQMGFSSEAAEASIEKLSDGIQGLPTSLDSIVSSAQNIALITGNLDEATDVALALNNAMIASGASTEVAASATEQYDKMLSTGKVNSQSWLSLQQAMPYALQQVAKELGITTGSTQELYDAMQAGTITFDEFNTALVECSEAQGGFAEMAQTSSAGIATSWENVKTAVVRGVANMIQAFNDAAENNGLDTIQESLNSLRGVIDTVFNAASKAITVFVSNLDTIVAAVAPVVAAVAGLKIVQTVSNYFKEFKDKAKDSVSVLQDYTSKAERTAQATEKLEKAQKMAATADENYNKALEKSASALEKKQSAEQKAQSAADNLKKAEEDLANATDDAGEAQKAQSEAAAASEEANKAAAEAAKEYKEAQEEVTDAANEQAAASTLVSAAQEESAAAIEGTSLKAIAQSAIMNVLTGDMKIGEAAVKAFNAAWDANPIGLVTTAITAVVSGMTALISILKKFGVIAENASDRWSEMKDSVDEFMDSLDDTDAEIEKNISSAKKEASTIKSLAAQVDALTSCQTRSTSQTEQLNSCIDQLNELVPGLGASFDEVTNSLNMSAEAFDAFTTAAAEVDILTAATDAYTQKEQELADITEELTMLQDEANASATQLTEAKGLLERGSLNDVIACRQEQKAVEELAERQAQCSEELDKLETQRQEQINVTKEAVIDAYNQQCAALDEMVANDTISYAELSEANQQTVDDMKAAIDDLAATMNDGTQSIVTDLGVTRDAYLDTMEQNQQAVEEWGNNMESLRDRMEALGLDTAVLDQWAEVPDQGIPLAAEFVDASDEELARLAELSGSSTEEAAEALLQGWGVAADEIPSAIQEYVTTPTEDSIADQLGSIDWSAPTEDLMQNLFDGLGSAVDGLSLEDLGIDINEGVAEGMEDTSSFEGASQTVATDIETDYRSATQTNSPSQMTKPIGTDLNEGIAEGMQETESLVSAAEEVANVVNEALTSSFDAMDFSGIFDGFADAATEGMSTVEQAVTSGMTTVQAAMTNGFTNMGASVTSAMSTIAAAVSSGMANVSAVMTSGVTGVRTALIEGFSNMSSSVTTAMTSIQSAVSSGMASVSSTMTSGVNQVRTALTTGFQNMATTVTTQMNKIKSTITTAMNNINSTVKTQLNNIKSTWSSTMSSIQSSTTSGMNKVKSAFTSAMSSIRSSASSTKSSIISTFNSMYSGMYSAGASAMSGLQAGLNSRSGSVLATARSIANSVTSTINSALKVGSPSRVMKATGKDTIQGLINGMKAMLSKVESISDQIADTITDMTFGSLNTPQLAFEGGVEMSMDYYFDSAGILDALDDLTDAVIEDSQKPVEITTVTELDGREIAKGTAQYMQDAQDKLQSRNNRRQQFSISGG